MVKKRLSELANTPISLPTGALSRLPAFKPIITPRANIRRMPSQALRSVTSKDGHGIYASSDTLFKGAIFGRDSLEVAEDLMKLRPKLVEKIILTLAELQGEEYDNEREEEPGKIIHEYRTSIVDGRPIDAVSQGILESLSAEWGGDTNTLAYYGSIDSTPLFLRVVDQYISLHDNSLLSKKVRLRSGHTLPMGVIVENAADWITQSIDKSSSGLLEYQRLNPRGIENQAWKDSKEFYIHENGERANHSKPIASVEVQALAFDALVAASRLLPKWTDNYVDRAQILREQTIKHLWQPHRHYFALGTDYDNDSQLRVITTKTANPAEMLDSGFFDGLEAEEKKRFVSGIVQTIMSHSFLTDAGVRSRALEEAELVSYWDYHGSFTSWPKETYDIAKGMTRQGFPRLAKELGNRLINLVMVIRAYPEFVYVDGRGRVLGTPPSRKSHGELVFVDSTNRPEKTQAWTVSAILALTAVRSRTQSQRTPEQDWQNELEKEILRSIPLMPRLKRDKELTARYPSYPYELQES